MHSLQGIPDVDLEVFCCCCCCWWLLLQLVVVVVVVVAVVVVVRTGGYGSGAGACWRGPP